MRTSSDTAREGPRLTVGRRQGRFDAGEPLESPRSVRPDTGYASLETDGLGAAAGGAADVAAAATAGALADGDDIAAAEFWSRGGH